MGWDAVDHRKVTLASWLQHVEKNARGKFLTFSAVLGRTSNHHAGGVTGSLGIFLLKEKARASLAAKLHEQSTSRAGRRSDGVKRSHERIFTAGLLLCDRR